LWRVASRAPLRWRGFDSEWVVFHPDSGDTHLLDPLAAATLRVLEAAPSSAALLVERLPRVADLPVPDDLAGTVAEILRVFDEVGLIEPVDDPA
jgi:PqqD family protein of HPr-rel-A system